MMGGPLGSSRVSSQKQNREGVVRVQSGQYRATVVERARDVVDQRNRNLLLPQATHDGLVELNDLGVRMERGGSPVPGGEGWVGCGGGGG
ncbi:hypothetical protein ACFX1Z_004788 [Malus domestica]